MRERVRSTEWGAIPRSFDPLLVILASAVLFGACFPGWAGKKETGEQTPGTPSASDPNRGAVERALRRLSRREYNNVVRDLLGDTTAPADAFGTEIYVNGFDNGSDGLTVQGTDLVAFQAAAETLAARAMRANRTALIGSCDPAIDPSQCVDVFLQTFVKKAYRRPPTETEVQRLRDLDAMGTEAGGFEGGITLMLEAVLQSPSFLYRSELGLADDALPQGLVRLTNYELASELSFLVTGSMPDDALFAAAESGRLVTADDMRREAARLLVSPAAKPAFRAFFHQWLATDHVATTNKDKAIYPAFTPAVAASMAGELDRYFDDVIWQGEGSIRELFTSPRSFVDANLAAIYGIPSPSAPFSAVSLDPDIRRGILTRPGFLAVHSDNDSSGPVPRGVFVLNALLCRPPRPPPANVPPAPPASSAIQAHETTRQRFDAHLNEPICKTCHTIIDGVGFGFEQFDGIGAYRTMENGSPVDTSGTLLGTDVDGPFDGVSALATKLETSQEVLDCFARQVYRYAMGQEEPSANGAAVVAIGNGFTSSSPVTDLFTAIVVDPVFAVRTTSVTAPAVSSP